MMGGIFVEDTRRRVLAAVDEGWDHQVDFLRQLVRAPSVLMEEAECQRVVQSKLHQLDLEVDVFDVDIGAISGLPGFSPVDWSYQGRPLVVGVWPTESGGGRSLVLNGHIDVVSPEPVRQWKHDPWGAEVVGERMYGRGALDMKSGVSAMVYAVRALQSAGVRLKGDVILQSVIEEECSGNGTLACLARGHVGDAALIPEPSGGGLLEGELGVLWLRIVVPGRAGHVLGAHSCVNAIDKAYYLREALRDLEQKWNRDPHPAFAHLDHPINFNPGVIRGGDWPSTVPAECQLVSRLSFYPGVKPEEAKALVLDHLREAVEADSWLKENPPEFSWYGHHDEGFVAPEDDPLMEMVGRVHQELRGAEPKRHVSTAVTDARFWRLYHDRPATCYGPKGGNTHAPDEWVDLPSVRETTRVIALSLMEWCGVDSAD